MKASSLIDEWLPLSRIVQHVPPATLTSNVSPLVILAVLHEVLTTDACPTIGRMHQSRHNREQTSVKCQGVVLDRIDTMG